MSAAAQATRTLLRHPEPLAVVRLGPGADLPQWATQTATLLSVTATAQETSVVCGAAAVPRKTRPSGPYAAYEVAGPLDHGLTGVLAGLLVPLADAGVPVFTISTFDTDWVLVPGDRSSAAEKAWRDVGHRVVDAADRPGGSS